MAVIVMAVDGRFFDGPVHAQAWPFGEQTVSEPFPDPCHSMDD